ncbi:MAG: cobyrinate a,c-diamide synthase [Pseudomonadota bacterium]
MTPRALVLTSDRSGAGKTVISLGLMRALRNAGHKIRAAKSGPDYIDPRFHEAATGHPSVNLDAWAMDANTLCEKATNQGGDLLLIEGAMGVLDCASDGLGSVADLAEALGAPVVVALDVSKQAQSAALAIAGLRSLRPAIKVAGVILNRVGSQKHVQMARTVIEDQGWPVLGAVIRDNALALPERHLGLVQAAEMADLQIFLNQAADRVTANIDLGALAARARPLAQPAFPGKTLAPIGQRIAVAQDVAFAFAYPHVLADWRRAGAEILPFSPLANEAPDGDADAVYLPGGYPELHAARLSSAATFRGEMKKAAEDGTRIYGECGGYMVLGDALLDADRKSHSMLGLLPVVTSFAERRLSLGYRRLDPQQGAPWSCPLLGHEFHYASVVEEGAADPLYSATEAHGGAKFSMGLRRANVSGSFAHVIGPA